MCGIAGFSGRFSHESLAAASRALKHRGPDAAGQWLHAEGSVGLAHRRLSIIDLSSAGAQPMESDDANVVVIFNGEIYNYRELASSLREQGHRFHGHSDTEVLLHLYQVHGAAMLPMLNGIFAFAIWDARRSELLVARDAMGVKPLYYFQGDRGFAFASEIKGLLAMVPEAREIDLAALDRYLTFMWCPGNATPLKAIRKVNPGEALLIKGSQVIRRWAWYRLPALREHGPELGEQQAVSETARLLRMAVQRQLVSDVPVGAFLSGGLDSSSIVAFARQEMPGIRCFTIDSGGQESGATDDLPYARQVARHLDVPLDVVKVSPEQMAMDFQSMIAQLDEPLADPAPLNVLYISRLARENGIKVLMSGAGGDDLFSGYRRHAALVHEWTWNWLPLPVQRGLAAASGRVDQRLGLFRRLSKVFNGIGVGGPSRLAMYFEWTRRKDLMQLRSKNWIGQEESAIEKPMLDFLSELPQDTSDLDAMLALEQRFFLADHNLIYTDKMSMAAGVEVRVPFLDLELVEHAARIPATLKQRGREGKWILKKAMEPYLPAEVIYRPKAGFGAPLRRWMRTDLRELVHDLLSAQSLRKRGLFEPEAVARLIARTENGRADGTYTLFSLLAIEVWCRAYLDAPPRLSRD